MSIIIYSSRPVQNCPWVHCSVQGTPRNRCVKFCSYFTYIRQYWELQPSGAKKLSISEQNAKDKCCLYIYITLKFTCARRKVVKVPILVLTLAKLTHLSSLLSPHVEGSLRESGRTRKWQQSRYFLHKMRFLPLTGIIAFIFCPVSTEWLHRVYQQIRGREKGEGL